VRRFVRAGFGGWVGSVGSGWVSGARTRGRKTEKAVTGMEERMLQARRW